MVITNYEKLFIDLVCFKLKVSEGDIRSKSRLREICEARQMVSYLLFTFTKKSMWEIAEVVNYKSHASVFRDKCNIPALIKTNKYFAKEMIPIIEKAKQIATDLVYVDEEVFDFYSESAFLQDRPGKLFTDNTMLNLAS